MLDLLDKCVNEHSALAVSNGDSSHRVAQIDRVVLERQNYLRAWIDGMHIRVEFLSQRGQVSV
jgi:hypothetical protein